MTFYQAIASTCAFLFFVGVFLNLLACVLGKRDEPYISTPASRFGWQCVIAVIALIYMLIKNYQ